MVVASPIHGRGVAVRCDVAAESNLGQWPVLMLAPDDPVWGTGSLVERYVFETSDGGAALTLGIASLLNHSVEPNCRVSIDESNMTLTLIATRDLAAGEECCIDYGPDYWDSLSPDVG